MSVEDKARQSSVIFSIQHDWRDPISGVYVSPGSAETLVRRGGIANHYSLVNFLYNISSKNYQNPLMFIEVIVCYISVYSLWPFSTDDNLPIYLPFISSPMYQVWSIYLNVCENCNNFCNSTSAF